MSPNHASEAAAATPDIFDMERVAGSPKREQTVPVDEPAKLKDYAWLSPLTRKVAVGGVFALATLTWIVWPDAGTHKAAEREVPFAAASRSAPNAKTPVAAVQGSAGIDDAAAAPPQPATPAAPAAATMPAAILQQQAEQVTAMIAAIDALNTRISALETRIARAPAPVVEAKAAIVPKRHPQRASNEAPALPTLPGFTLNTIFPDQAWIARGDQVYAVQVGDAVEGMRVLRIDAHARTVTTTGGLIR